MPVGQCVLMNLFSFGNSQVVCFLEHLCYLEQYGILNKLSPSVVLACTHISCVELKYQNIKHFSTKFSIFTAEKNLFSFRNESPH